jgi:hypothetical protein
MSSTFSWTLRRRRSPNCSNGSVYRVSLNPLIIVSCVIFQMKIAYTPIFRQAQIPNSSQKKERLWMMTPFSKWCYFAGKFGCELAVVSPVDLATSNGMLGSLRNHLLGEIMLKPGLSYIYIWSQCKKKHCFKSAPRLTSWFGSVSKPCTPSVHIKIAGKWMFIPLKMVLIGIDPY